MKQLLLLVFAVFGLSMVCVAFDLALGTPVDMKDNLLMSWLIVLTLRSFQAERECAAQRDLSLNLARIMQDEEPILDDDPQAS